MNADQARQLKRKLSRAYPGANYIAVAPEPDGAQIVISGVRTSGNSGPGDDDIRVSVGNGVGPVLQHLLAGQV